jgi:hypothetical protein
MHRSSRALRPPPRCRRGAAGQARRTERFSLGWGTPSHDAQPTMDKGSLLASATPVAVPVAVAVPAAVPVGVGTPILSGPMVPVLEGRILRSVQLSRTCKDAAWALVFFAALAAALGSGGYNALDLQNKAADLADCPMFKASQQLADAKNSTDDGDLSSLREVLPTVASVALGCAALAVLASVLFLRALEVHARIITWCSVCMMPVLVFASGVWLFQHQYFVNREDCQFGVCQIASYIMMFSALIVALIIWVRRAQVELTVEILRMSATAFKENLALIWTTSLPNILICIFVLTPIVALIVLGADPSSTVLAFAGCPGCDFGRLPTNGSDVSTPHGTDKVHWDDLLNSNSCGTKVDPGPPPAAILSILGFMYLWCHMLAQEMSVSTVGGCIGLHYFETPHGSGSRAATALKWTLSTSFGSICQSSLILTIVEIIDQVLRRMAEDARRGDNIVLKIVMEIVLCLWRYLEIYINFLTKMAVISLAITGDTFCGAAKKTHSMLLRHNLDGIFVDAFAGFTLRCFSLACAVVAGFSIYFIGDLFFKSVTLLVAISVVGGLISYIALMAVSGIVLVVCNTHYMCYILDLDHNFAPQGRTLQIHALYKKAIGQRIMMLRSSPKQWARTGPGKREKASGMAINY